MSKRFPILVGLILLIVAVWVQISSIGILQHYIDRLESLAYDVQLRARLFTHPQAFETSVVIVDVDDKTLSKEGRWPWSRSKIASLVSQIQAAGAVVIALDMLFPESEVNAAEQILQVLDQHKLNSPLIQDQLTKLKPYFDNDAQFAKVLQASDTEMGMSFLPRLTAVNTLRPPIMLLKTPQEKALEFIKAQGYISNIPVIQNAVKTVGFVNVFPDEDGIIRRVPLLIRYKDGLYPSLAIEAVRLFLLTDIKLGTAAYRDTLRLESIALANHIIPCDPKGRVIVPFRGRSFSFPYYSATDVLHSKIPSNVLAGKIVFVGTSATGLGDLPATAVESAYPGVEIQATIADGILTDNFSFKPAWGQGAEIVVTIAVGLLAAFLFPYLGAWLLALMIVIIPGALIFLNNFLWEETGVIISIFIPILLVGVIAIINMLYGYLFETRRREELKDMFGQYVPERHIDEMLSKSDVSYGLYGEDREMTVLFADIRNFTSISEGLSATQIKEMLNDFFTPMTEVIFNNMGTIDKYVGDLIMAFWGAPLVDKDHAEHGMIAALEMQKKLTEIQTLLVEHGWPDIRIGIGLNTGHMSVGDMGSQFRRNYTVLGDAVNLASRVEGLTKYYGVQIIITEFTKQGHASFVYRELDKVRVKGKQKPVTIYELIGWQTELTNSLQQELKRHDEALQSYYNREWDRAEKAFAQLQADYPNTRVYKIYLDRIAEFKKTPPPENWEGVYTLTEK